MSAIYDDMIAPKLWECAKLCEEHGIAMVCYVDDQGESCRTRTLPADASFAVRLVDLAAQAHGNVDSMMIALIRHAREHGPGTSIFLKVELDWEPQP